MLSETITLSYNNGQLWMGDAVANKMPASMNTDIADVESLTITLSPTYADHINKASTMRYKDISLLVEVTCTGKFITGLGSAAILKKWLYASQTSITGGSISATAFENATPIVGDILPLPGAKTKASSVVVTDSTGSPKTLVLGTNYELDADAGIVKILDLTTGGAYTNPLKAAFTEAAATANNLFQSTPALQGMRFKGINLANNNAIEILDLPRIRINPASDWSLLADGNEFAKFEWDFEILTDTSNLVYPFGRHKI